MSSRNLGTMLQRQVDVQGANVAVRCKQTEVTWEELGQRSSRVANGLLAEGATSGTRVAYLGKNSDRYFEVLLGASKVGGVLVPINWRLAAPEVQFILNDSEAIALFVDSELLPLVDLASDEFPHLRRVIVIDGHEGRNPSLDAWAGLHASQCPEPNSGLEDIVVQLYTSGTTGRPKGAELSNRYFVEAIKLLRSVEGGVYEWETDDVVLIPTPLFHMSGILYCVQAIAAGCKSIVLQEFTPGDVLTLINQEPIRVLPAVPAMVQILLDHPLAKTTDFSRLSFVAYGASPMPPSLLGRAIDTMGCEFTQGYGMTESALVTALAPADHRPEGGLRMASVGTPLPTVDLRIVDENDQDVPCGEVGEIVFRGPVLFDRYWKNELATSEAMRGGYFHTGDAACQDEDGYVYLKDRIKDMIISGGENVYPAEVEHALHEHPSVREVAVIGVSDERWGEVPKAFVVSAEGSEVDIDELKHFAAARIAKFKVPKHYEVIDELPRTASGKVLRRVLRGDADVKAAP